MMGYLLGVDGGGTKTEFVLVDAEGHVRATYQGGSCYYIQIGFDGLHELLTEGVQAVLSQVSGNPADIDFCLFRPAGAMARIPSPNRCSMSCLKPCSATALCLRQ